MIKRNKKGQFVKGIYLGFGFKKDQKVWNKGKKGIHLSSKSEFKKGMVPWNKGIKGLVKLNRSSIKSGEHRGINTEFTSKRVLSVKNINWKGNNVGYFALHSWVQRMLGKADHCSNRTSNFLSFICSKKSKMYHWANKSRTYKRNKRDWIALCVSCHLKADRQKIKL